VTPSSIWEPWAGQKSFQRKQKDEDVLNAPPSDAGSNPTVNYRNEEAIEPDTPVGYRSGGTPV
jgi:hypothetical protein